MTEDKENTKYIIGDLLWAKIGSHPWWPCMVSYDPFEGCYYKKKTVRSVETTIYHVQYFGKQVQHGWTLPGLIFPFEGERQYRSNRRQLINNAASASLKKKISAKYFVPGVIHEAWIIAIREAEDALEYENHERYESFVFKYDLNLKKSAIKEAPPKKKKKKTTPPKALETYGCDENLCKICSKGKVDLQCLGVCKQFFHKECLGLINAPENFLCNYCESGLSTCAVCKKSDASAFKCLKCKHHFHEDCLRKFPLANVEKKICSLHTCVTCYNENPRNVSAKGSFINCIQCPSTFHATLHCMPLGSVQLSSSTMICPEHFKGKNKVSPQVSLNIPYCAICSEGGTLICCESCPNAYHVTCINTPVPEGDFFCESCKNRKYLYVGMILWVKTGLFRWWPAQAISVDDLPQNVKNKAHCDGEFPVQYFGTEEYFWTHRGRVIPYHENHKNLTMSTSYKACKLNDCYKLSLEEAAEAYDNYILQRNMYNLNEQRDAYKHIKVNRIIPPAQSMCLYGKLLPCNCFPDKVPPCGPYSDCLNRSCFVECNPSMCSAGDRCENQRFQKRQYAKVKLFRTKHCGWGLKSKQPISKGMFIIEYVGEIITHEEYQKRAREMQEKQIPNYYFLYLDSKRMIDAGPQGNLSRFINHSCDPNCEMEKWDVNGDARVGIFAIKDICPGEELTFNYQSDSIQFEQRCFCRSQHCQGIIGRNLEKHKNKKLKSK